MAKEGAAAIRRGAKGESALGVAMQILRGLLMAVAVTVLGVAAFALIIKWTSPSDTVISVVNQALKLLAIFVGVRRGGGGVLRGAVIGVAYMLLGVLGYAFLSGLETTPVAYLADIGMGVAAGGLCGMVLQNTRKKA